MDNIKESTHIHNNTDEKNLLISVFINIFITVIEIIGSFFSGSLALLSDAMHNLSDSASLLISYFAILIGKREKNLKKTYGYKRAEIIAALFNIILLFFVCIYIIIDAIHRINKPETIKPSLMLLIAIIGFLGNGISVILLFKNAKENINIKSAFLHLLTDTISSIAVILISIILLFIPVFIIDSIFSVLLALYIIKEGLGIFFKSLNILMQATPENIDNEKIKQRLLNDNFLKIKDIHHIHSWDITPGETIFDAHIVVEKSDLIHSDFIICKINEILENEFGIKHITIQLESTNFDHNTKCEL